MATYIITANRRINQKGAFLEKGSSIMIPLPPGGTPFDFRNRDRVNELFKTNYAADLKAAGCLVGSFFSIKKIG